MSKLYYGNVLLFKAQTYFSKAGVRARGLNVDRLKHDNKA